ncbi:MAG: ECF-type sigma factor [Gemmatimonadales bacterium]|nr:ECF-type sigma factor [Gemmatimonadales bacterium]
MTGGSITQWLTRLRAGDQEALDHLFPLIELKVVARSMLRREATGHTLGPTALVHEAYFRRRRKRRTN